MKEKITILSLVIMSLYFSILRSQTAVPYFSGFDSMTQQAGWTNYRQSGDQSGIWFYWGGPMAYSSPTCVVHLYPVGGDSTLDWFVSPAFDFSGGGKIDSVRHFFDTWSVPQAGDTVAIFLLKGSPNPTLATSKTQLFDFRGATYINDGKWHKTTSITIPPTTGQSYIAFKYKTYVNWLDVRFDNLAISANAASSFSISQNVICKGEKVIFTDNSGNNPTSWNWQFSGGTPSTSALKNPTVTFSGTGVFQATLVSSGTSGAAAPAVKTVTVNACLGLEEQRNEKGDVLIFPNPTSEDFVLQYSGKEMASFILYDIRGREVAVGEIKTGENKSINLQQNAQGVYMLVIGNGAEAKGYKIIKK